MPGSSQVISGIVRDAMGHAVTGARIALVKGPVPLQDIALMTAQDGAFSLAAPAAGTYEVSCHAEGFPPQSSAITVAAGTPARIDFLLRR